MAKHVRHKAKQRAPRWLAISNMLVISELCKTLTFLVAFKRLDCLFYMYRPKSKRRDDTYRPLLLLIML